MLPTAEITECRWKNECRAFLDRYWQWNTELL